MDGTDALALLDEVAVAIQEALGKVTDWGLAGTKAGQYHSDLAADAAALGVLDAAGVGVLSEESGRHWADRPLTVVLDPLDGSTNASRGIPWFATSLCAVDAEGPLAALVVNLPSGERATAVRGAGAEIDGRPVVPSGCSSLSSAIVGLSGMPPGWLGWKQYRALGACALDLCTVASGTLDGYLDCSWSAHGPWDYLGGLLVCTEAGAVVADAEGRDLVALDHDARRTPVAAATPALLEEALAARRSFGRG
jgi:fructose-1,6-bisphosphatase/inositol monophosphatase family enzyme